MERWQFQWLSLLCSAMETWRGQVVGSFGRLAGHISLCRSCDRSDSRLMRSGRRQVEANPCHPNSCQTGEMSVTPVFLPQNGFVRRLLTSTDLEATLGSCSVCNAANILTFMKAGLLCGLVASAFSACSGATICQKYQCSWSYQAGHYNPRFESGKDDRRYT